MSHAANWLRRYASAFRDILFAVALAARTLMIGSIWKIRMAGFTSRIAWIAWMVARTSCRFISSPRCFANGLKMPPSPPAQEKNEISLIGEISGASSYSLMCLAASVANAVKRVDERGGKDVDVVRPAVVPQVPDDLHPGVARGAQHAGRARKVVDAAGAAR